MSQTQDPRNGMPEFYALLEQMANTHHKKSHDYASNDNPSGNYHFAGKIALLFKHSPEDAGFAGRIAEKMYRLSNLEGSGKNAVNETVEDTEVDIVTITALWMADRKRRRALAFSQSRIGDPVYRQGAAMLDPRAIQGRKIDSCNIHDKYEVGCKDCRSINGLV